MVGISNNQAFFWSGGHLRKLSPPPGYQASEARAVNDKGQAAGKADRNAGAAVRTHALLWEAGGAVKDLGVLPGYTDSVGRAINNKGPGNRLGRGDAGNAGAATSVSLSGVFVAEWPKMKGLGSIPRIPDSKASALNDKGQVVGNAYYRTDEAALLWQNGKVYELNTLVPPRSGWKLQNALVINNRGWIIGNGIHNGIRRGFLLTPIK